MEPKQVENPLVGALAERAKKLGVPINAEEFATLLDQEDPLSELRNEFSIPQHQGEPVVYLVGNSLGLQPRIVPELVNEELRVWAQGAIIGHLTHPCGRHWVNVDEECVNLLLPIVGAESGEVAAMGSLTENLHLLLCAFYHPTLERYKIVIEERAFPSDHYLVESQIRLHGHDTGKALVLLSPRRGESTLRTEDILTAIREQGESIALLMLPGVQYYTGQLFDCATLVKAAHQIGAYVGLDLAHAVGNVELFLHDWNVDFAAWCSYKYLNSGPGGIAGLFVHNRHDHNPKLTILRGWWGHEQSTRFLMTNQLEPTIGAKGFQLSNPNVLAMTTLLGSLRVFAKSNVRAIRQKSLLLTAYLRTLLFGEDGRESDDGFFKCITPLNPQESGAQLSIMVQGFNPGRLLQKCEAKGVFFDVRNPDLIRLAPTGMYNTFSDVLKASKVIKQATLQIIAEK